MLELVSYVQYASSLVIHSICASERYRMQDSGMIGMELCSRNARVS